MKGIVVLGTESKVGKTYCSILLLQQLLNEGATPGYFKWAATGVASMAESEAALVQSSCRINQELSEMLPFIYPSPGPVHLVARASQRFINQRVVMERFAWNLATHSHMVVEGVGDVISPLIMENDQVLMQEDFIFKLQLGVILVVKMAPDALNQSGQ